jgi:hypothetical protein
MANEPDENEEIRDAERRADRRIPRRRRGMSAAMPAGSRGPTIAVDAT